MNESDKKIKEVEKRIKKLLAEQIGVELEDIKLNDRFNEDLHMSAVDLTDFALNLQKAGFTIDSLALDELETVEALVESLSSDVEFL